MRTAGMHDGNMSSETTLRVCKMTFMSTAKYGVHFTSQSTGIQAQLRKLGNETMKLAFCNLGTIKTVILRTISGLQSFEERKRK